MQNFAKFCEIFSILFQIFKNWDAFAQTVGARPKMPPPHPGDAAEKRACLSGGTPEKTGPFPYLFTVSFAFALFFLESRLHTRTASRTAAAATAASRTSSMPPCVERTQKVPAVPVMVSSR